MRFHFVRKIDDENLTEKFLVSAVFAVLGIRIFLSLAGYPQLGGSGLHFAHMLWGGVLMVLAIISSLLFLNNSVKNFVAILGGIGFGVFIDEVGKFITRDNNYFFRPTFSIIYVIFIFLYLFFRTFEKRTLRKDEYLANSIELLKETVINDLDIGERKKALFYLKKSDSGSELVILLKKLFYDLETIKPPKPNIFSFLKKFLEKGYFCIIQNSKFYKVVITLFILQAIVGVLAIFSLLAGGIFAFFSTYSFNFIFVYFSSYNRILLTLSNLLENYLVIKGVFVIRNSRNKAFRYFKRSLLVSIFFTQIFLFYENQLFAFLGLVFDIIFLNTVNFLLDKETLSENLKNGQDNSSP